MPEYSDIYVITKNRNKEIIYQFLDMFLPNREEHADEYYVPQYTDTPEIIFYNALDLIQYCCEHKSCENSIYWRALQKLKPEYGMVYFLKDGSTIYGLSTNANDELLMTKLFKELKLFLSSEIGYMTWENSPEPETYEEFEQYAKNNNP